VLPINEDEATLQLPGLAIVHLGFLDCPSTTTVLLMAQDAKVHAMASLGWLVHLPGKTQVPILVLAVLETHMALLPAVGGCTWMSLPYILLLIGPGFALVAHYPASRQLALEARLGLFGVALWT